MDTGLLFEPPFTDIHFEGLDGVFGDAGATKIIHLLEDIELKAAA
jgi:type I restriction enzyme R subunit